MYDDLGYLLRPVQAGMCKWESVHGTELSLMDFAYMNDYLDITAENSNRFNQWWKDNAK